MAQIEFIGDDNYVLIDDNFKNMVLGAKSLIVFPVPSDSMVKGSFTTFSYTPSLAVSSAPLIAINSAFPVTVQSLSRSGNTYTWTLVCSEAGRGRAVEVFVFHLPEAVPNAGGLLQLFNAAGELVFDSSLQYSKVERSLAHNLETPSTVTLSIGRKYAAVTSSAAGYSYHVGVQLPGFPQRFQVTDTQARSGFYMQGASVRTELFIFTSRTIITATPASGESYEKPNGLILIFDVTGM